MGLKNKFGFGFDFTAKQNVGIPQEITEPGDANCKEIPDFGTDGTTKSAVVVLSNGNWNGSKNDELPVKVKASFISKQTFLPGFTGTCGLGCLSSLSVSMAWPKDAYDSFPGKQTGSSLSESSPEVALTNTTGLTYGIRPITQGVDATGKPIVTRISMELSVAAWGSPGPDQQFGRSAKVTNIEMVSQDGEVFTVDPSSSGSMGYDYANYSNAVRVAFGGYSPTVSGQATGMSVTGTLTFSPPTDPDSLSGTATLSLALAGTVYWQTNPNGYTTWLDHSVVPSVERQVAHNNHGDGSGNATIDIVGMPVPYSQVNYFEP